MTMDSMTVKQTISTESSTLHYDDSSSDHEGVDEDLRRQAFTLPQLSLLLVQLSSGFSSLSGSPPELYKAYALKFLDSYSYFSFSIIFTLFLSEDFGFSDVAAGGVYGACRFLRCEAIVHRTDVRRLSLTTFSRPPSLT